jgi:hypothetical protein
VRHRDIAAVAVFTALVVGSDFVLAPFANVKLLDVVVFVAAFVFGLRVGVSVAILSETIWGFVSPWGIAGAVLPFLIGGELLFALSGYFASKRWAKPENTTAISTQNAFFGGLLAVCAFAWDFETNIATGLLAGAHSLPSILAYEIPGIPFMIMHESSDFVMGCLVAPLIIVYTCRLLAQNQTLKLGESKDHSPVVIGK